MRITNIYSCFWIISQKADTRSAQSECLNLHSTSTGRSHPHPDPPNSPLTASLWFIYDGFTIVTWDRVRAFTVSRLRVHNTNRLSAMIVIHGWLWPLGPVIIELRMALVESQNQTWSSYPPCGLGSISDHGRIFQGIFPWLITFAALYTVQGVPKSGVAPSWKKAFSLMKIMRWLRISRVYGKKKQTKNIPSWWPIWQQLVLTLENVYNTPRRPVEPKCLYVGAGLKRWVLQAVITLPWQWTAGSVVIRNNQINNSSFLILNTFVLSL